MRFVNVIPARLDSTRFPRKLLKDLEGTCILQRTYNNIKDLNTLIVTNSMDIVNNIDANIKYDETPANNGTERICNILPFLKEDIIVNVQGDEVFFEAEFVEKVASQVEKGTIVTVISPLEEKGKMSNVCTIMDGDYIIDFQRGDGDYKHIGIYGFHKDDLSRFKDLPVSEKELNSSIEPLRWVENGFKVKAVYIDYDFHSINIPEDLEIAKKMLQKLT